MTKTAILLTTFLSLLLLFGCRDDVSDAELNAAAGDADGDSDADSDADSDTDSENTEDSDGDTDENTDPAQIEPLFIEAECALDAFSTECLNVTGLNSDLVDVDGWGANYPSLSEDGQVGYTNGGAWFAFENIDLSTYNVITLNYACGDGDGEDQGRGFYVRLDAADGPNVAFLETGFSGGWDVFLETTTVLPESVTGTHTVYFVAAAGAETDGGINNGNVDWVRFSYDEDAVPENNNPGEEGDLFIEAECAIDSTLTACANMTLTGSNSDLPDGVDYTWGGNYPSLSSTDQVGYTDGGSWIAFDGIDLTDYSKVTIHYTCGDGAGEDLDTGFWIKLDAPDGENVGILETEFTGGWDNWVDATADLTDAATGVHTIYFVANYVGKNNGNVDWILFHN